MIMRRYSWLLALFFALLFALPSVEAQDSSLNFQRLIALGGARRFSIHSIQAASSGATGLQIGSGELQSISAQRLALSFAIVPAAVEGRLSLRLLRQDQYSLYLALHFQGSVGGHSERIAETVRADRYLAENGHLAFRYNSNRYFFQLSRNSRGENRMITNWGAGRLQPQP
ncbi:MAG: hypothetical protein K1X75_13640 [Leptospirales bacterium]|nr:hypothetical protein [Leptospirales bacterium]